MMGPIMRRKKHPAVFLFRTYAANGRNGYYAVDQFTASGSMTSTGVYTSTRKLGDSVAAALDNVVRSFIRRNNLVPGRKVPADIVVPKFEVEGSSGGYSVRDVTNRNYDMVGVSIPTATLARTIAGALSSAVYDFRNDNGIGNGFTGFSDENRITRKIMRRGGEPTAVRGSVVSPTITRGVTVSGHYDEWSPQHELMARRGRVSPRGTREWERPLAIMEERAGLAPKRNKRPAKQRERPVETLSRRAVRVVRRRALVQYALKPYP